MNPDTVAAMGDSEARVGLNEAVFREVNERLRGFGDAGGAKEAMLDLVCECGDAACTARIEVASADYERARSQARQFLVAEGHVVESVETVIQKRDGWDLIEKHAGRPAEIAEKTDPRS